MEDKHYTSCGAQPKHQTVCQWKGCDALCEDSRVLTLTRMNPYIKYVTVKLCNIHLIELSNNLSQQFDGAWIGSSTDDGQD